MRWVPALLLLLLGGAALAGWLLDGEARPPLTADPAAARPEEPAAAEPAAARDPERAATLDATAGDDDDALVREASGVQPRYDVGPVVRVVRGAAPVADAVVCFLNERELDERNEREGARTSRWDGPERFGRKARTDANGELRLPAGRGRWFCTSGGDGEFGFVAALPRDQVFTLALGPDEQFEIVTRHPDGAPASVEVAVLHEVGGDARTIWRGETDAAGRAAVRHFQLWRPEPRGDAERFAAVARVPVLPPCATEFGGRPAPNAPVELVVPPLGALTVQLTDHFGAPLLSPASVGVVTPRYEPEPGALAIPRDLLAQRVEKPAGAAPVQLPALPIDARLRPWARYPTDRRAAVLDGDAGPDERGGEARVQLPPSERHVVVAARLLQPDRRPVASSDRVTLTLWEGDRVARTARVETIADGRFDLVWAAMDDAPDRRVEFRYRADGDGDEPTRWLGASVAVAALQAKSRVDLGEVVLAQLPPLCAGIVVDDQGAPIANALVRVQQNRDPGRQQQPGAAPPSLEVLVEVRGRGRGRGGGDPWRDLPNLRTRTGPDGTFVLDGPMPPGEVRVLADDDRHFAASVPLAAPDQSLRVELARNGVVRGRVLLPDWIARGAITLTLRPLEEHRRERDTVTTDVERRRRFTLEPVRPGRYDLLVTMRNLREPLATIPDLWVRPGVTDDARLAPLDLQQALFRYRLRARDQAGGLLALDGPIHARLQQLDGSWTEAGFRWQDGRAELITAHGTAELTFFGRGFEPQKQTLAPGDHDVYLRTLQPALVEVPGARALCGPTRRVRISAILQGETGLPSSLGGVDQRSGQSFSFPRWDLGRSSGGWLEQSDVVQIPLMQAGKYQIILRAHATESTETQQASVTLGTFELRPDGATVVTVPLDSQQLLETLRRLDQQWQQRQQQQRQRQQRR